MKILVTACFAISGVSSIPLSPGGPYNTSPGPIEGRINVHLVPHTHDDVGWLKTIDELYLGGRNDIQISAVQFILDSVVDSLLSNPDRKFIYAEMAFFSRWWRRQNTERRSQVLGLLKSGQLEFINGGWDSNDEATPTFVDIIDQHTMGTSFIAREFGTEFNPTVGWQVDPFGHSMFQAKAYAKMGMNAWFFGRSDSQDFAIRSATRNLETIHSGILAGSMDGYGPPSGFNWNIFSKDEPLNDDEYLGIPNIDRRINDFVTECLRRATIYNDVTEPTKHIMLTMGSDFEYEYAHTWFSNMDKLIHYANLDGRVNVFYSTPSFYTQSRSQQSKKLSVRSDYDWFPYCDSDDTHADADGNLIQVGGHAFWTGYFTSRPLLKRLVRQASTALEACRVGEILYTSPSRRIEDKSNPVWKLWEALSVVQHHDGVSGTARQLVTDDYTRRLEEGIMGCQKFLKQHSLEEEVKYHSMMSSVKDETSPEETDDFTYYFAYYNSSIGKTAERSGQASGAYIFRPDCPEGDVAPCRPTRIPEGTSWVRHKKIGTTISWSIGPIPQDNGLVGKEVVLVVEAKKAIKNRGVFFTDSNGYQWMRREVNKRVTWTNIVTDPVAGNYYPVVAGIAIVDKENAMVVATDRTVGGSSLKDGEIEIMIHRRTFVDDDRGVGEPINEKTSNGEGIVVEGHTDVTVIPTPRGKDDRVPVRVPIHNLRPWISISLPPKEFIDLVPRAPHDDVMITHFHRIDVPQICQLGSGEDHDCLLIRLVHRDIDEGESVLIDFSRMAPKIKVVKVTETVLHAGRTVAEAEAVKIHWIPKESSQASSNAITIKPGDMRTFILEAIVQRPPRKSDDRESLTVIEPPRESDDRESLTVIEPPKKSDDRESLTVIEVI